MRLLLLVYALLFRLPGFLSLPVLPNPDPANIQPFFPNSPPATIPAFPEQSDLAGCPLDLPNDLFPAISHACVAKGGNELPNKSHCCPVLAAWLYAAYSGTALRRAARLPAATYDLPVLPDDSETCVENLGRATRGRGIHLPRPNDTCDLVYCYCGIRLHVPSCMEAFRVSSSGKVEGNARVRRLERECGGPSGLGGCNRCLRSLYQLNEGKNVSTTDRKNKMHSRDCELMGLTWLLAKNRSAYMPTVSSVLRATMVGQQNDGSHLRSCSVGSNGMPLAVDSALLDTRSPSSVLRPCPQLILLLASILYSHVPTSIAALAACKTRSIFPDLKSRKEEKAMEAASSFAAVHRVSTSTLLSFKSQRTFSFLRPIPGNFIHDRQYQNPVCVIRAQKPKFVANYANSIEIKEWELARMQDELAASQGIRIRRRPPTAPPLNYMGPFEFCLTEEDIIPRNILEEIIWQKDKELSELKERIPLLLLKREIDNALPVRDFLGALKASYLSTGRPALIAEVKKASPSRGVLQEDFDPVRIAHAYEKGGAACLSILTDEKYFQGGFQNLEAIRNSGVKCPLLCKEFIIDAWQIYYARLKGADAVLLIAAVLPDLDIRYMIEICRMLGLVALVEVHNEGEMDRVLGIHGIQLIGINNRDLETFNVDISNTKKLLEGERGKAICERDIIVVGESGLFTPDDITYVQNAGVKAVLVGESIVKQSDPARGISSLFGADISV